MNDFLSHLPELLPRIAEEGSVATSVAVLDIQNQLCAQTELPDEFIAGSLAMLQKHWEMLGLLERAPLHQGHWQFTSFPASLVARSLLDTLQQPRPQLAESDWWQNEQYCDRQRELLIGLENRRKRFQKQPVPIRFVQVAWALIQLEGRLLLNHREDKQRPQHANYVLIGGRLSLHDLEDAFPNVPAEERLQWHQNPDTHKEKLQEALRYTLSRELHEELELRSEHYKAHLHHQLAPYEKLEGARANHAFTRYHISAFAIELNDAGFRHLCRFLAQQPRGRIIWATPEEIAHGSQADRRVFVDAWREEAGNRFEADLKKIPTSYAEKNDCDQKVDLPLTNDVAIRYGETAKEKPLPLELSEPQLGLLLGLAWHRLHGHKHPLLPPTGLRLHPLGWIELIKADDPLRRELQELSDLLREARLPLLQGGDLGWFRYAVPVGKNYFAEEFFECEFVYPEADRYEFHLHVAARETPVGRIPETTLKIPQLSPSTYYNAKRVFNGEEIEQEGDFKRSFRESLTTPARQLGLRIVIREKNAGFYTNCTMRT